MTESIEVRDSRSKGFFWIDNELIRNDGQNLGVYGIAVYAALCMYAGNDQRAFPSIPTLAEVIGCSAGKVRDGIRALEDHGWIRTERRVEQADNGALRNLPNLYHLLPNPHKRNNTAQIDNVRRGKLDERSDRPDPSDSSDEVSEPGLTTVVNVRSVGGKRPDYDVYIGRPSRGFKRSEWANPYKIGEDGDRAEVVEKYREYLVDYRPDLLQKIPSLVGKRLGCWCAPDACHGDVLAELANSYNAGTWSIPERSNCAADTPALYTVAEIKAVKLTRSQWEQLKERESRGRNRKSIISHCESKLSSHPMQPRFDEMLKAVDACTVQSLDDPGMAATFARVVQTKLWESREKYYTPEELLSFSREVGRVENVWWLPGELSKWKNTSNQKRGSGNNEIVAESSDPEWWRKFGRTENPIPALSEYL